MTESLRSRWLGGHMPYVKVIEHRKKAADVLRASRDISLSPEERAQLRRTADVYKEMADNLEFALKERDRPKD